MTTTSPRAIGRPLTRRSTGSPAMRFSVMMEPGPRPSVSPIVMRVRPISTASSTGTACSRARSASCAAGAASGIASSGPPGSTVKSTSIGAPAAAGSANGCSVTAVSTILSLLHRDVGEQDVLDLDVGLLLDRHKQLGLELLAPLLGHEALGGVVGQLVGDEVADHGLLRQRAEALRRLGGLLVGRRGRLRLVEHEADAELGETAAAQVDEELLRQHVDLAVDLGLRRRRARLGEHELVDPAQHEQQDRDDELQLRLHLGASLAFSDFTAHRPWRAGQTAVTSSFA